MTSESTESIPRQNGSIRILIWAIGIFVLISVALSSANFAMLEGKVDVRELDQVLSRLDRMENKIDALLTRGTPWTGH